MSRRCHMLWCVLQPMALHVYVCRKSLLLYSVFFSLGVVKLATCIECQYHIVDAMYLSHLH